MTYDKASIEKIDIEKLTVGATATYSKIYDMNDYEACTFAFIATTLTGSAPDKWAKLVQAETSSSSTFASDIIEFSNPSDYSKSNSANLTDDALTQLKVDTIDITKKTSLTEKITLSKRYIRFKVQAGTNASEIIIIILRQSPKKAPVNQ
jgi:hypothetical protein